MNDKLLSVIQQLSDEMKAMKSFLSQAQSDSMLETKATQITEQIVQLETRVTAENVVKEDLEVVLSKIKQLTSSIFQEKAKNPLTPDELIGMAESIIDQVNQAEILLEEGGSFVDGSVSHRSWLIRVIVRIRNLTIGKKS